MRIRQWMCGAAVVAVGMLMASSVMAQDWPQWRGLNRDGKVMGFKAPATWPKELTKKWTVQVGNDDASPVLVGDNEQEVFLGQQLTSRRTVSERTAQQVDDEVARVIDTAFQRAKKVINENRALLDAIAAGLLERETLTRDDFAILVKGGWLPPRPPAPMAPVTPAVPAVGEVKRVWS